ncbi:EamA family transporter [Humitalea sp. 24SJ18S-53]|uniref:EamA family transporter n=1 Tax=Humitalea sp. 24SJ18S-53 TaxID=3422307 RepID=UPI003D6725E7
MIPLWLGATLTAALFQCWRTALQQRLRGMLSVNAAAVTRYLYGVPVGVALLTTYTLVTGQSLPAIDGGMFLLMCAVGGLLQILGTNLLIMSFGPRGFAVGTAYSKTEAIQAAFLAMILLGEYLSVLSWLGVAVSIAGVLYLSLAGGDMTPMGLLRAARQPAALFGLTAGTGFALCSIAIKAANLELDHADPVLRALVVLVVANVMQTVMQGSWLLWREPGQVVMVLSSWRISAKVGTLSAFGSACWFTGFALAPIALVRAVGQIEIIFSLLFGRFYLRETTKRSDVVGALTVVAGVLLVLMGR